MQTSDKNDIEGLRDAIRVLTPNFQTWIGAALDELVSLRAQADARPYSDDEHTLMCAAENLRSVERNSDAAFRLASKLDDMRKRGVVRPIEASAPGLSDEEIEDLAFGYCPSGKIGELKEFAYAILTRASAATTCVACEGSPSAENNPCAVCGRAATVAEQTDDAKRLEHIVAIGWEGLRTAWERFGEDHDCETALEEIRAVIDADRARPQSAQQQAEPGADERAALANWLACWDAAEAEGLQDALHDAKNVRSAAAERLADLIERRIAHGVEPARTALAAQSGQRAGVAEDDVLDAVRAALPEFSQQDDYLLAHGASLMSEESHEIIHLDTLKKIVAAVLAAAPTQQQEGGS